MSYETHEGFTFDCEEAFMKLGDQDDPLVQQIVFKTDTVESGQITATPKKEIEKKMKVDGVPGVQETTKLIPASELDQDFKDLIQLANDEGARITATVTEWNQADEEETSGDETYYFIRRSHFDTIQAERLPDSQAEKSQPSDDGEEEEVIFDGGD